MDGIAGLRARHRSRVRPDAICGEPRIRYLFIPALTLQGWLEEDTHGFAQLLPIAQVAGDGSIAALWRDGEQTRVVMLSAEGKGYILAETARDFLDLLAIGYEELLSFLIEIPPEDEETIEGVSQFRAWVEETFQSTVPEQWPVIGGDHFSAWLDTQLGRDDRTESSTPPSAQNISITGDVAALLKVLGENDGAEVAALVAEIVGIELGQSLSGSNAALRAAGVEIESNRHGVATIWITVGNYPRPAELIDGFDASTALAAGRELLGEPESQNEKLHWMRYTVDGRYLHLTFENDALSLVTLKAVAPWYDGSRRSPYASVSSRMRSACSGYAATSSARSPSVKFSHEKPGAIVVLTRLHSPSVDEPCQIPPGTTVWKCCPARISGPRIRSSPVPSGCSNCSRSGDPACQKYPSAPASRCSAE